MENDNNLKIKHAVLTFCLVVFALVLGVYIGYKNKLVNETLASVSNFNLPKDIKSNSFNQFFEVWNLIDERHPDSENINSDERIWGAIGGMVDSLEDPYTTFLKPEENENLNIDLSGEFFGVGMEVGVREEGLTVIAPLKDSPAEKAGVLAGDLILKIDNILTSDLDIDEAINLIRGEKGTVVTITIFRKGDDETKDIQITRDLVKLPFIETEFRKEDNVFIIDLFSFNNKSIEKFEESMTEFKKSGADKLIIDLRNNPGGYLSAAIDISSLFLEEGKPIVIEKSKIEKYNKTYRSSGNVVAGDYKVAILVNGGSASASEIVAGALQQHGKAILVGTKTFGKGSVQELIPLENNTALKITIAQWLTPNGLSISKEGLTPDVEVDLDLEKFTKDGIDSQLEKAIESLKK